MHLASLLLPQEPVSWFGWTYVWLGVGVLVLVLSALTFAYLVVRRRSPWLTRLANHPALGRLDQFLSDHVPRLWTFIRRRFTIGQWHGLELTVAGIIAFLTLFVFALIAEDWTSEATLYALDQQIYVWLMEAMTGPMLAFMEAVTYLGNRGPMIAMCVAVGLFLLYRRDYWRILTLILAPGVGSLMVTGVKRLFERMRPEMQITPVTGHSFPSGHAFAAMAFFGFLIYLTWRVNRRDAVRVPVTLVLIVLIVLVGVSRIVLRVHWFTDVAGGFTAGLGWLVCCIFLVRTLRTSVQGR